MPWVMLVLAGLFEVAWASSLKFTEGFTKLWPTLFFAVTLIVSLALLAYALRTIDTGTGYAVWSGIGAIGTVLVGIFIFNEPTSIPRIISLLFILSGIVGLKLVS